MRGSHIGLKVSSTSTVRTPGSFATAPCTIASTRGPQGGYGLARPASKITIGETIRAVEGRVFEEVCGKFSGGGEGCHHSDACGLRPVWQKLGGMIEEYLDRVTLEQLAAADPQAASGAGVHSREVS